MTGKLPIYLFSKANAKIGDLSVYEAKQLIRYNLVDIAKTDSIRLSLKEEVENFELKSLTKKRKKKTDINYINSLDRSVYGNYAFFSPEGLFMFYTSAEKMLWYLYHDLADIIDLNPYKFKLKFIPKGYGHHGRDNLFYLSKLKNVCVVCGSDGKFNDNELSKHHVLPYCYRKYMIEAIKNNSHHDVLLLCKSHHREYEVLANLEKKKINSKMKISENVPNEQNKKFLKIQKIAKTICFYQEKIPQNKINIMKEKVESFYGKKLSEQDLHSITKMKIINNHEENCYKQIVDSLKSNEQIVQFISNWRLHFVKVMNPKFLPNGWDIYYDTFNS